MVVLQNRRPPMMHAAAQTHSIINLLLDFSFFKKKADGPCNSPSEYTVLEYRAVADVEHGERKRSERTVVLSICR
jgi:hypothetical protein